MRPLVAVLLTWISIGPASLAVAVTLPAPHATARHKSGPVSIRGIASNVRSTGFSLKTTTKGTYAVITRPQTQISEKGKKGKVALSNGDHVRVRGFVNGLTLTAISVQIIPVKRKAKAYTLRGTVQTVSSAQLVLAGGAKPIALRMTSKTTVDGVATSSTGIKRNDRVSVRVEQVGSVLVAMRVHVYKRQLTGQRVQLHGTVQSVSSGAVTVSAGSTRYQVALTGQTSIRKGTGGASARDLRTGETVTIHACCQGGALTATSIRILLPRVPHTSTVVHGVVVAVTPNHATVRTSHGTVSIGIAASTPTSIGSAVASSKDLRVGDAVTVRAVRQGSALNASSIHVLAISRQNRTVDGTVVAVSRTAITVDARGKRFVVAVSGATAVSINARKAGLGSIHAGDRVKASGQLSGTTLRAARVAVTPAKVSAKTVRGVIQSITSTGITVIDPTGAHYLVRPARGVRVLLRGKTAPTDAVFPGVKIEARGHVAAGVLTASTISITVASRTLKGRVVKVDRGHLTMQDARSVWVLDLAGKPRVVDGKSAVAAAGLGVGAYIQAQGYLVGAGRLRTTRITVLHPQLSLTGTVVSTSGSPVIQTSGGGRYTLRLTGTTAISAERAQIVITRADIPNGARVHVDGKMGTDGSVKVSDMTVRLSAITIRGRVTRLSAATMTLTAGTGAITATLRPGTTYFQGSRVLKQSDVVVGDDVTLYGYKAVTVLARKLLVHRKRMTVTGTVASITSDGLVLTAADGQHRVIVSSATVVTLPAGQTIAVGASIHVSGYLRGDGVVLATRITVKKSPKPTPTPPGPARAWTPSIR